MSMHGVIISYGNVVDVGSIPSLWSILYFTTRLFVIADAVIVYYND